MADITRGVGRLANSQAPAEEGGRFEKGFFYSLNVKAVRPDAAGGRSEPAPGWAALRLRHPTVFADLPRQVVIDLGMAGDGAALIQGRVVPPRMATAFPETGATMGRKVSQ